MVNNVIHTQINLRVNLSKPLVVVTRPVGEQDIIMMRLANNHVDNFDHNDERMINNHVNFLYNDEEDGNTPDENYHYNNEDGNKHDENYRYDEEEGK